MTDTPRTQDTTFHPLASVQQGIWLDQIAHPGLPYYNIGMSLEIRGKIDVALFEKALEMVANRHDTLRLSFSQEGGLGRQCVLPEVKVKLKLVEFSEADDDAGLAMAYLRDAFRQPFESLTGQLWEAQLVRCGPNRHYWLARYHHLVTDGIGVALIGHAVGTAYNALLAGSEEVPDGHSYLDFVADDQAYLQSSRYERDRQFWQDTFAELPPALLQRRADYRASTQAGQLAPSEQVQCMLPRALYNALGQFAGEHKLSLAHVLISVVAIYFSRTEGVDDLVIGMPVHNRTTAKAKATSGMFSSVSPIRLAVQPEATLLELMQAANAQLRRCYRHQRFPIADLNRLLGLARLGRRQLFEVSLSFESLDGDDQFGGTASRVITMDNGYEQTPMAIFVRDYHPFEDVHLDFNFNTAYFSADQARHFQQRIVAMLEAVLEHAETPVARFPLMSAAEQRCVLEDFNPAPQPYPAQLLVHGLFEEQVRQRPQACALRGDTGPLLSYDQLNRQANRLAHRLIALGAGPDARVAVCLERGPQLVVALLATLKAGAAYVPVDPALPAQRQAYMLDDSAPMALLSTQALADGLPASSAPLMLIDTLDLTSQPDSNPDVAGLTPQHLAYVLYTSGSTGMPKGVMNEHAGVVNRLLWARDYHGVEASERILQKTPFGFDVSVWEFFLPLLAGAELVLARPGGHQQPEYLADLLNQAGVTMLHFVPSMLEVFLQQPGALHFPALRRVLCSGEALPRALQQRFESRLPGVELHNLYGPTEAAIDVTAWQCRPTDAGDSVPIGRPIANIQMYVLDALHQPLPIGVAGELHIGGVGVARGYFNRPDLSAERFVETPLGRLYKTGDLGRWRADGALEYLGRNDFQVKIRGFRIELGEIESALLACEGVREAVVIARNDSHGDSDGTRLVAYLCGAPADASALRAALLERLPEYMVPSAFVVLEQLPLNSNGKLDRRALPAPGAETLASQAYAAPEGDTEQAIAQIWQSLLGVEQVGRDDGFLALGGHSLLTVQLQARLLQELGVQLDLQTLFAQRSLRELATRVDQHMGEANVTEQQAIVRIAREQPMPLSLAQQRLWFLDQLDPAASLAYHMPAALHLRGELNVAALKQALDRIVARHESLRARFPKAGSVQFAPADCGFSLVEHDLRGQPAEAVEQQRAEEARTPFDLGQGPLVRGRLLRIADDEHLLLVTQHHIVSDGWSVAVMIGEFNRLYAAFCQGQPDPLPPLDLQYADYAAWQQQQLQGERLQHQLEFWQQHLRGAPALLELPADRPRPAEQSYRGAALAVQLPAELSQRLRQFSQQQGLTPFMTLLGAWSILLSRLSNQAQVVLGTPVANRTRQETEALIGFFVNTLALHLDLSAHRRVDELLAHVKATTLDAYEHQAVPFEQVVEALQPERSLGHSPLFQAMLVLGNTPQDQAIALPGVELTPLTPEASTTQFDLTLALNDDGETFSGQFEYATDLFDASTIARWREHLLCLLDAMLAGADQPLATLPLLSNAQRRQLLNRLNPPATAFVESLCAQQAFEAQVRARPQAKALEADGQTLSYAELNARANRVAHRLIALGVRPDDRVALLAERSPAMIVGVLGILKAGGAYVPLDPNYPGERLQHMLEDSAPKVLLTQAALAQHLPTPALAQVTLESCDQGDSHDPQVEGLTSRHLAYVIYTSGSTGKPKGVMIEHRSLCNQIAALQERYGLNPQDRVLQFASLAFDMSVEEIFGALFSGATLVLRSDAWIAGSAAFASLCEQHAISVANLPTVFWQQLARDSHVPMPTCIRQLMIGGEAVSKQAVAQWFQRSGHRPQLFNAYGPTEATVNASVRLIRSASDDFRSIGEPLRNTQLHVLDAAGQLAPLGAVGEIHIGGVGVARGYLNREELSAERFIADPFSTAPDARLYKTGDQGRWCADGTLHYLGRNDDQVKIRGFRVELGEIESVLASCPGVREAVVVARPAESGGQRLIAYLCGEPVAIERLREHLLARLPEYMLPSAWVRLETLPLTPNGKLDRKALPAPGQEAFASRAYEAPRGALEQRLAQVWQDVLGVEQVGRHDRFFELGGHSLLAVSLIDRLREQGLHASVRTVFSTPTLWEMAQSINRAPQTAFSAPANGIPAGCTALTPDMLPLVQISQEHLDKLLADVPGGAANVQDIYPLAPLQQGMLFHHLLGHQGDAYLVRSMIEFDSRAHLQAFTAALQQVIDRHDVLRTAVHWAGQAQPLQVVQRQATLPVTVLADLDGLSARQALERASDPRSLRLNLNQAPLMHAWSAEEPDSGRCWLALLDHHLISDHVSLAIVLEEVQALMQGQASALPEPVPYREFIAHLQTLPADSHTEYFQRRLADIDTPTAPFGQLDVQGDAASVHEAHRRLPNALAQRLRSCARQAQLTPAVLFHVAWAQVLARCTGQPDVVFGTVLAGRSQGSLGAGRALGVFINTLPVRVALQGRSTQALLEDTAADLAELLRYEQAPLTQAQRCSAVAVPLPLFTTLLNYRHQSEGGSLANDGAVLTWDGVQVHSNEARTNYPIEVAVGDEGTGFSISAQAVAGIDPTQVAQYLEQAVASLVDALQHDPARPAQALEVLPDAEREQLLRGFNHTAEDFGAVRPLHQQFEDQARQQPDATALVHEQQSLSYRQLNRRANHLTRQLLALGVQPDDRVALCAERSLEMIVGVLGVLKAGAAYVPLDPANPAERMAFLLADSQPCAVLAQAALTLPEVNVPRLALDTAESLAAADDSSYDSNPQVPALTPEHLAYVIYTSGSTGQAKGVMVEHRSLFNFSQVLAHTTHSHCTAQARVALNAGFYFDMSLKGICQLGAGHCLVIVPQHLRASGQELLDFLEAEQIQAFDSTPSQLDGLLAAGLLERERYKPRSVLLGGEPINAATWARLRACPSIHFYNMYGPTEGTVDASQGLVAELGEQPSIGRPLANVQLYVLDAQGQPAPIGVAGELHIGGAGVARGYLNRPELTAERFIHTALGRLYKTGDLGRWRADGTLEYLGRNDFQVKIRGFRIELGEIESALLACNGVREAAVIARDGKQLVAYLCGAPADASALRAALLERLPEYMVPSAYVVLEQLPLTANGKLDRRALPAPGAETLASQAYAAPEGDTEQAIAQIWQSLLGVEQVGRDDGFLALGGHSLLTVQLQARLLQELGVQLDLQTLFAQRSLRELAECVDQARPTDIQAIEPISRTQPVPLSLAQQRLWFLDQLDPAASLAYHMPAALHLRGKLNVEALKQALDRVIARHESLRARFPQAGSVQFAPADCGFSLVEHDLRGQPAEAVEQQRAEEARTPFDLGTGPLVRGRLLRIADDEHLLLVTQHHIVSDGWSVAVMIGEFNRLYAAFCQGQADPLPPLALQYADYAAWQQQQLQGERLQHQLEFWQQHLRGAPALLELPTDRPRPAEQSYRGAALAVQLPAELSQRLRQFSQQHGLTPFMTLLGAWSILLSRLSNQAQVVVGTPVANRTRQETEALIGFFVNTLALHLDLSAHRRVDELLAHIKATTLDAYEHQAVPFEQVVEALQPERSLGHSPLFQAMLVLGNTPQDQAIALPGVELTPLTPETSTTQFDLTLALNDDGQTFSGQFEYATDLFDASTIARWREHLLCLLDAMLACSDQPLAALPLLTPAQAEQLQQAFSGPQVALDERAERLPQRVFQAQAARTPDALAVASATERCSYAQLNARANQVAHWLIGQGVGPDDTVGLCAGRSAQMVAGLLGILKAGAAYVPLDANYPAERLAYMLADSAPRALVCDAGLSLPGAEGLPTLELGSADQQQAACHDPQAPAPSFGQLAYVIYTSGSTGKPKGVMVEHRGLRNLLDWYLQDLALDASDAVLLASSYNFDLTQKNILAPLMTGAALHLAAEPFDPRAIVAHIHSAGVSHLNLSPSAFRALVEADPEQRMAGLKRVVLGGEPIQLSVLEKLAQPRPQFINSYGPTECSDVVAWHRLDADLEHYREQPIPIGLPIRNLQLHVLDEHGQVLPIGVVGEIHIGGAGVARGYLNRPELTAERFIDTPQGRLYKTGDLGRWAADGILHYLGRNDEQLKIRGLRVEPGEIEAALASLPGVREAALVARDSAQGKQLVAYLCGEPGEPAQLREALASQLPAHMLPAAFVTLPALPLTPNGKLDRRALPEPSADAWASSTYEAPQGPLEQALAGHWQALLGVPQVGRHDNFFALGGHSMMAVSLIERLRGQGLNADVRTLFSAPTLKALAQALSDSHGQHFRAPANGIPAGCTALTPHMLPLVDLSQAQLDQLSDAVAGGAANIQDIYPLAPLQQGILFHHMLGQQGDAYLVRSLLEFDDRTALDSFLAALQQVIDRHDILRTGVHWDGLPQAVQVVQRQATLPVQLLELQAEGDALEQLKARTEPSRTRLDLRQGPLMRACIARQPGSQGWLLALLNHHMASDHVTLETVLEEIHTLLHQADAALPPAQPFRDFIAQALATPAEVHEAYFSARLSDIDTPTAPFDELDVQGDGSQLQEAELALSDALNQRLRSQAQALGVTPAALFHVAWAQVLARCTSLDDVVFGTVVSGRLQGSAGAEHALGVFINTLPVRVSVAGQAAQAQVLATHQDLIELLAHEQAPLALAQRCSGVASGVPLFTSLLNYRHQRDDRQLQWPRLRILGSAERSNYPLALSVNDHGHALSLTVQCLPSMSATTIGQMMLQALQTLSQALAAQPDQPLAALDVLPAQARERALTCSNADAVAFPGDPCIQHLFEAQVRQTPQAIAVQAGTHCLSYVQLNTQADQLARQLIAEGVLPGELVALCVARGAAMIVGLLGILKAGAAYVPLDSAYPSARLTAIVEDARPRRVLADAQGREALGSLPEGSRYLMLEQALSSAPQSGPAAPENGALSSASLAYVIYTSGSTGTPKGVMIEHRQLVASTRARLQVYGSSAERRFLLLSSVAFDSSVAGIFGSLCSGDTLCIASAEQARDPLALAELIEAQSITTLLCVPSLARPLLASLSPACSLREMIVAGEACPADLAQACAAREPALTLYNEYGPTEATVWASVHRCGADEQGTVPIGRGIPNARLYVLDPQGRPVPQGVAGELYVGGAGVARGYLDQPALSAERFLDDPFCTAAQARMYRTGDRVRQRQDGALEFLGRLDQQIKLRGLRIEPGEIEARMLCVAGVREALVIAREDTPGVPRLVAYLSLSGELDAAPTALREYLGEHLPAYMVPAAFVVLERLPLSPNGKVDRNALPAPQGGDFSSRVFEAPQGETETELARIWAELLGLERVGRHDHFFELGGHSLLAVQVTLQARQSFGVDVPLREVFEHPTLDALADLINTLQLAQFSAEQLLELEGQMASLSESELLALVSKDA
ncbi:non-ribosomal peptide synthase/polyketide synthase [Pseudomonas sp. DTU_2021_1001937_2_SI_NGA_ILE_001]|uniref:non-ribosomal peptide synthetase n=1 Tax=Pseudomonas sp. DTU_2021_1001937_2_SI_NGA_ILE_001 TaxID=3077589 RepID=UPI0028FC32D6|nr:non-ribosomal peptide synthase/polyketide synthase [Pseudomonas sp. DTU_2021_1001937_2_SI_NGA_ILE_001]WNW10395.1 non-ribosomal peptide synthase/polyketide synthase [Pseudomonas sp. DTU_2021_1001937_2_SI_NGA_ILE_001]